MEAHFKSEIEKDAGNKYMKWKSFTYGIYQSNCINNQCVWLAEINQLKTMLELVRKTTAPIHHLWETHIKIKDTGEHKETDEVAACFKKKAE